MLTDEDFEPQPFYAQIILTITEQAPLLAAPRLARVAAAALRACDPPGSLWGYVVLPELVRLVAGPTEEGALQAYVDQVKTAISARLLDVICQTDGEALDWVLRYNPVWGGVGYQVWQAGSHRAVFWSEYKLSNALYELRLAPVTAGLVSQAGDWPYTWIAGDSEADHD